MSDISLREFYDRYYRPLQIPQASCDCYRQYETNIGKANAVLGRAAMLSDLSDDLIARVCGKLLSDGRSPSTANKVRGQLVALWNFAAKRGLIATWPTLRKYQEYRREPTAWSKEQLGVLFEQCRRQCGKIGTAPANLWWLTLLSVLWDTGLRIGAAVKLEWKQIDFERGYILVKAEQQKDREDAWFRLHEHTLALLKLLRADRRDGVVFEWPYCKTYLWLMFGKLLRQAGLPNGRRDKFHKIRRSVASWFEVAGGNATELLGHSGREITRLYLDPTICQKPQAADRLFRPGEENGPTPPRAA